MKKLLFTLLVTVALLLGSNTTISAQPTPVAPAGSGTEADPWQIATLENLYWIAATDAVVPSPTQAIRWTKSYIQTADIDASPTSTWFPDGLGVYGGWSPIGDELNNFTGRYNGDYHTINNLYIFRIGYGYGGTFFNGEDRIGLFGIINSGAVISNIGLTNAVISGSNYVGVLVGKIVSGTVTNAYTTGSVTGFTIAGGMVGEIVTGTITNAYSTAKTVTCEGRGGLVGRIEEGIITNAYAIGIMYNSACPPGVLASQQNGGLAGSNTSGIFNNCFWDTQLSGLIWSAGGTGKTADEMRTQATFTGWDFTPGTGKWQMLSAGSDYRYCPGLQGFAYDAPGTTPAVNPIPGLIWAYSGGDGTSGSPFQIADLTDLKFLSEQFYDLSKYFIQTANIDAMATSGWNNGLGFSPIGKIQLTIAEPSAEFTGNYNGNYHTITGLYINRPTTYDIGLFGYVASSGSISKVGLVNVAVTGKQNVGGLVGYFNAASGNIANTYVTGHVSAEGDVGGLVGEILDGTVTNVYSTANVTGGFGAGGLVGATRDNITNAYSTGLVTGGNTYMGGLIGWQWATIVNSFWDKQTSGRNSSGGSETGKTTIEMKLQSTFTGWDFTTGTDKWKIKEIASLYKSYPYLQGFTYDEPGASPAVNPIPGLADLYYSGGTGTPENPYQIATLDDLQYLSEHSGDWAKSFIQTADIDAAATSGWNSGYGFSPIGNTTTAFAGNYNGQNHTINGLYMYRPYQDYIGMFGYNTGTISNLGLTNVNITGGYRVGGLVGIDNPYANITRVYTTGSVKANTGDGGGLVGTHNAGTISNAYSRASVSGSGCRGGLIGWHQSGTVSNVYSTGSVSSSGDCIGGLIGGSNGSVTGGFWDTQTSGQATSAGGTGKTTAEMKTALAFVGNCWDFQVETGNGANDYWGINATDNSGYPFLSWQGFTNTATYPSNITIGTTASPTCGWSISGGVLTASTNVSIHVDDIKTALIAGNLTIQASNEIIIDAAIAPALTQARTLTLKAGGNISMYASASIAPSTEFALSTIIWSDADATNAGSILLDNTTTINTKGGHVWIGGGSGSADWNGLIVGNGYAKSTSGTAVAMNSAAISTLGGDIQIKGESTATTIGSDGISIYLGSINAGSGNVSLYGIGGQALGAEADCDGIRVNGSITTSTGNITLTGTSTTEGLNEGIAIKSNISSTSGNISLITDIFWMSAAPLIGSSGNLTLKPYTDGNTIGIAGGAGTLILPAAYFTTNFVDGFSGITIGSSTAGNIGIKAIPFNDPVTFNAVGNLNLENDIDLNGQTITLGNEITLNEASGRFYGTTGDITTTRNLSNISAVNVAGLGATLTTSADMGATAITRGHSNQNWGEVNSVLRYFDIEPSNNTGLNATMVFNYHDAELNSLTESKLFLYKSTDGGTIHSCEGGTVNTSANTITLAGINDFSRWMAAEIMTINWNGAGSDFNTAANWAPNTTPSLFYNINITDEANDPIVNHAQELPTVCNNLTIASGAVLTIAPGKALTVNGTLTNSGTNAGLVIKSTADGTGSLINSTAGVSGTVERYIAAATWTTWNDGWHFLASPIADHAVAGAFTVTMVEEYDFYAWSEKYNKWINFKETVAPLFTDADINGSATFELGKSYMAAYKTADTKIFSGILNAADVSVSGLVISSGNNKSWHLLGNPFTSALTWDASADWNKQNIGGVAKIWNESIQGYSDLTSSPATMIPATNGFMVMVSSATGSLKLPATKRTHSAQGFYKSSIPHLQLVARNTNVGNAQESNIIFNPDATASFDLMYDGEFLAGYGPQFYSVAGDEKLSTNTLPEFSEETVIPFNFIKNEGTNFTIEATGIETLEQADTVFLKDNKLGISHNLSENPVYVFTSAEGDAPARFELHFGSVGINETPVTQTIQAWYYGGTLTVKTTETLTAIDIFNIQGQHLQNYQLFGSELQTLQLNLPAGVYFARIVNGGTMKTVKMIVQ